jgi:hypothetical protein
VIQFSFSIQFPLSVPLILAIFIFLIIKKSRKLIKTKKSTSVYLSLFLAISAFALRLLQHPSTKREWKTKHTFNQNQNKIQIQPNPLSTIAFSSPNQKPDSTKNTQKTKPRCRRD